MAAASKISISREGAMRNILAQIGGRCSPLGDYLEGIDLNIMFTTL